MFLKRGFRFLIQLSIPINYAEVCFMEEEKNMEKLNLEKKVRQPLRDVHGCHMKTTWSIILRLTTYKNFNQILLNFSLEL